MKKMLALMTTILAAACHTGPASDPTTAPTWTGAPAHAAPTARTTAELAGRRAQMIAYLHDYMEAGQYPTDDTAGLPRSVFVDSKGVRCPMAELIWRSGHQDLVEAVAREHNEVRLADVHEGPLVAWMEGSGLTMDEINLIQGAADLDMVWLQEAPSQESILARGEVRGRLESAEQALRAGTQHSLEVAVAALPNGKVPIAKIEAGSKVVPVAAMTSHATGRPLPTVALVAQPRLRRAPRGVQFQVSPNGSFVPLGSGLPIDAVPFAASAAPVAKN
jgi:hypothetical protein